MLSPTRLGPRLVLVALAAVLAPATAQAADAAELDRFLPPDTEVFLRINLRQAFEAKLVKPGITQLRDLLTQLGGDVSAALKDLEFDPFTDLDTVTVYAPNSQEKDKGLVVLRGKFKLDKFRAKGEEVAKDMGEFLKLHTVADGAGGKVTVYEVRLPGQDQAVFVAFPNETTVLLSAGKDYVADAIKRGKAKAPAALKNKEFQALLEKIDPKQTIALAGIGEALAKQTDNGAIKEMLAKMDAVGGGITLADDIKLQVVVAAKTVQEAKELTSTVNDYVTKGLLLVGILAMQEQKLTPVVDILKTVRCTAKDKAVTIKAEISAEVIEALQKALAGG
jgi:hypothetical protein